MIYYWKDSVNINQKRRRPRSGSSIFEEWGRILEGFPATPWIGSTNR